MLPQEKDEYYLKLNVDGLLRGDYQSRMLVTFEEIKNYLRIDSADEDVLLLSLAATAESLCSDILRYGFQNDECKYAQIATQRDFDEF